MTNEITNQYREKLREFLLDKMKLCLPNVDPIREVEFAEIRRRLVDEGFNEWIICFTHRSINPNPGKNYENMELLGDQVMSLQFIYYLQKIFPGINESQLSELKVSYLQTNKQAELSLALGLPNYLISELPEIGRELPDIQEDLLEAFFGTLYSVGNFIFGIGFGNILSYNMIIALFYGRVDFNKSLGNAKTRVKEILEVLPHGSQDTVNKIVFTRGDSRSGFIATITLPDDMYRDLTKKVAGLPANRTIIVSDVKPNKTEAENDAFEKAAELLERVIGLETIIMYKHSVLLSEQEGKQLLDKIKSLGYQRSEFARPDKIPIIQLLGVLPDGTRRVLYSKNRQSGISIQEQYKELVREYLQQV